MAEREEELKRFLMKVKEGSEKAGLKLGLKKLRSWQSGHITSWQMDGGIMETVRDFILGGGGAPKSLQIVNTVMKLKDTCSLEEKV